MPRRLTVSKASLAKSCLYWAREDIPEAPQAPVGEAAQTGTLVGLACNAYVSGQPIPELEGDARIFFDNWVNANPTRPEICLYEVAFAFNIVTGEVRVLGFDIDRKYAEHGAGPNDICGSCDLLYLDEQLDLCVRDYKCGRQQYLDREDNFQVAIYAAMAAKVLGYRSALGIIEVINEEGVKAYAQTIVDPDAVLNELAALALEAEAMQPEPQPGPWCREKYCPQRATCPALTQASTSLQHPVDSPRLSLATAQDVASVLQRIRLAETQLKAIEAAVEARVLEMGEDIYLDDGTVYGMKETVRESVDGDVAMGVLAQRGVRIATKATKKDIELGVKAAAPRGKAAAWVRDVMDEIAQAGGIKVSVSKGVGWKK